MWTSSRSRGEKSRYETLYDIIVQGATDDHQIKAELLRKGVHSPLPVLKTQLYNSLLQALEQFHRQSHPHSKLSAELQQCRILQEKGLLQQAARLIKKCRGQLTKNELWELRPYLLWLERRQLDLSLFKGEGTIDELMTELDKSQMQLQHHYKHWAAVATSAESHYQQVPTAVRFTDEREDSDSFRGFLLSSRQQALDAFAKGDHTEAFTVHQKIIARFEKNPHWLEQFAQGYLSTLINFLIDCYELKKEKELNEGLIKIEALEGLVIFKRIPSIKERIFNFTSTLRLNWTLRSLDFSQLKQLEFSVNEKLERLGTRILPGQLTNIYYLLAYLHFIDGSPNKSIDYLALLFDLNKGTSTLIIAASFLELFCHYQLHNILFLESLISGLVRKLKADKKNKALIPFLRAFLRICTLAPRSNKKQKLIDEITHLLPDSEKGLELDRYINLKAFAQSLSGSSYISHL